MTRSKSTKIDDPEAHFKDWYFEVCAHHYWTLGVELKTFVLKKVPYRSWAYMTPADYNFCQGDVFYAKNNGNHYLQIGAEQGLFDIEVFERNPLENNGLPTGWITTFDGLAQWLCTGSKPASCRAMDFSNSKSGLMAWQLLRQTINTTMKTKTMSGAEFKLFFAPLVQSLSDDDQVFFGSGDLSFYRPKERGPENGTRLVQIEFNEVYTVTVDPDEA